MYIVYVSETNKYVTNIEHYINISVKNISQQIATLKYILRKMHLFI